MSLLRGARVLARRDTDGFYYLGHIVQEVESSKDNFLVEFEKCQSKWKPQFRLQKTQVCDMIHYEDARWRPLCPGDHVLAPLKCISEQYAPGDVLQGAESREQSEAFESNGVLVTFWNGKTRRIPPGIAIWISQYLCDRVILELHIPLETRKKLVEYYSRYPYFAPTRCRSSACSNLESQYTFGSLGSHFCLYCGLNHNVCLRYHVSEEHWAAHRRTLSQVCTETLQEGRTAMKLEKQSLQQETQPNAIHYQEKPPKNIKKTNLEVSQKDPFICDRDFQTKIQSDPHKLHANAKPKIAKGSLGNAEDKINNGGIANAWSRESPPSGGSTMHLEKTLHLIEKAMKEDCAALEVAVHECRPHTASLILHHTHKAQKSQEFRERKKTAQMGLSRLKAEWRQRRKEEMQEIEQCEHMLQDSRRLRSERRLRLEIERRQDKEGLEAQIVEAQEVAAEERYKKQEEAAKAELMREQKKILFWADQRKQKEMQESTQLTENHHSIEKRKEMLQSKMIDQARKKESDNQERHRNQQLQESSQRDSNRLRQFYRDAEQKLQKDKELQEYLKMHNLQALQSMMAL